MGGRRPPSKHFKATKILKIIELDKIQSQGMEPRLRAIAAAVHQHETQKSGSTTL